MRKLTKDQLAVVSLVISLEIEEQDAFVSDLTGYGDLNGAMFHAVEKYSLQWGLYNLYNDLPFTRQQFNDFTELLTSAMINHYMHGADEDINIAHVAAALDDIRHR